MMGESTSSSDHPAAMEHANSDPLTSMTTASAAAMPGQLNPPPEVSDVGDDDEEDDGIVIDGFAIDSDEDDDDGMPSNPFKEDPHEAIDLGGAAGAGSGAAAGAGTISKLVGRPSSAAASSGAGGAAAGGGMDHPLDFSAPASGAANASSAAAPAVNAASPIQTPAKRDLASGGLHSGFLGLRSSATEGSKQAGAFLSSFAQKAAHSIQEAAEGATKAVKEVGEKAAQAGTAPPQTQGGYAQVPQQLAQNQQQTQTQPLIPGQPLQVQVQQTQPQVQPQVQVQQQQQQTQQVQAQQPAQTLDQAQPQQQQQPQRGMDNAKKSALITSALSRSGGLLDGERVVVFLSPLSGVRDSSWNSSLVGGSDLDDGAGAEESPKWCCAVTFYRVVVFSYLESEFPDGEAPAAISDGEEGGGGSKDEEKKESAAAGSEDGGKGQSGDEDPSLAPVQTASVSRRYQSLRTRQLSSRGKRHHIFEIPLGSIERVERTTEFPPIQSYPNGGGGMGSAVVSGVAGGIGNVAGNVAGGMAGFTSVVGSAMGAFPNPGSGGAQMIAANAGPSPSQQGGAYVGLVVYSKHNSSWLRFAAPSYGDASRAQEVLSTYAFPGRRNLGYLFAFESRRAEVMASVEKVAVGAQGQQGGQAQQQQRITSRATPRRYDALREYGRMGVLDHGAGPAAGAAAPPASAVDGAAATAGAAAPDSPTNATANRARSTPSPWSPLLHSNATYGLCPSYPNVLFAPSPINDAHPDGLRLVRKVAAFRSEGRMPTLSWSSCVDGASLWRASQPRVGLQGNRSAADERYLRLIGECAANSHAESLQAAAGGAARRGPLPSVAFLRMLTGGANEEDLLGPQRALRRIEEASASGDSSGVNAASAAAHGRCLLKIMDLRPKSSAMANRTQGYGYENTSYYPNSALTFCGIGNIHAVRDAYTKMSSLCLNPSVNDTQFSSLVEDTKWLSQLRLILSASWQAAFHVRYNRLPVLLHCSHGWDRTSQVSALAQMLLDPYCRTREGFSTLVEKEFMSLGHPFHTRCGHGEGRGGGGSDRENKPGGSNKRGGSSSAGGGGADENQISPIFLQFVDCAYQVVRQYPDYFEYNERYLLLLSEHVYSCRFGTLLCDTERERELVAGIRQRTHCLWEYLDSRPDLVNESYVGREFGSRCEEESDGALMMPLPTLLRNVVLWADRHCMYGPKATARCIPSDLDRILREREPTVAATESTDEAGGDAAEGKPEPPLLSSTDMDRAKLLRAEAEAERWRKVAESRMAELEEMKRRMEDLQA